MNTFFKYKVMIVEKDNALRDAYVCIINGTGKYIAISACDRLTPNLQQIKNNPDILIIDPSQDEVDIIRKVSAKFPHVRILVCSNETDSAFVFEILKAGVAGFLLKDYDYEKLISGMDKITSHGAAISPLIARMIVESYHINTDTMLTKREIEILNWLAKGKTATQIAEILDVALDTSKKHIYNIYHKLKVNSRSEAIRVATQSKYIIKPHMPLKGTVTHW